ARSAICNGCENHCHLTVNSFGDGGKKYISGNQCQKALGMSDVKEMPNLYAWKREYFASLKGVAGKRGKIGLPLALGMFELAPLWHGIFTSLGFETVFSKLSTRATYERGQFSIPSDTACYPAKIMHGHIEELIDSGTERIFYPSLTYNIDEKAGTNHYNCPVVAYYAELLKGNMDSLKNVDFMYPYLNINSRSALIRTLSRSLAEHGISVTEAEVKSAVKAGFAEYGEYIKELRKKGEESLAFAEKNGKRVMILAGRPYHIDPEICHGIDKLASSLGFVVVSEDSVCHLAKPQKTRVLNQWTFHARLYRAARLASMREDTELVQLVSFGCGVDAITTDEVRTILEDKGKFYTQIKIDEITNLGAVKIRLRSLIGSLEDKERKSGKE
ncbi:MAG: acyl-CoA dehydratase activase-related protein, partial [Clostridia bacterium]|nr:acyl-CoA dehydratase activase-related protein [Clostridia bacterium]